eukprot:TRINITY_DN2075_c0_g3_i1.p2 TRINITY_DN2075_c0_g3~~TRINITY_DN2075_c0_g3_i1.p2  ORF type:complete len:122 (-),score=6.06 TRINITY_DN2075_c0_g3_i1:1771-2136(-)
MRAQKLAVRVTPLPTAAVMARAAADGAFRGHRVICLATTSCKVADKGRITTPLQGSAQSTCHKSSSTLGEKSTAVSNLPQIAGCRPGSTSVIQQSVDWTSKHLHGQERSKQTSKRRTHGGT